MKKKIQILIIICICIICALIILHLYLRGKDTSTKGFVLDTSNKYLISTYPYEVDGAAYMNTSIVTYYEIDLDKKEVTKRQRGSSEETVTTKKLNDDEVERFRIICKQLIENYESATEQKVLYDETLKEQQKSAKGRLVEDILNREYAYKLETKDYGTIKIYSKINDEEISKLLDIIEY